MGNIKFISFYQFQNYTQDELNFISESLKRLGAEYKAKGLFLIACEGVNGSFSIKKENINPFQKKLEEILKLKDVFYKEQSSDIWGFKAFRVKIKKEILSTQKHKIKNFKKNNYLSPVEWEQAIKTEDISILDVRNNYETKIGKFKNSKLMDLEKFQNFPKVLKKTKLPKDKKTLIYCTGGIRCEKAFLEMNEQGFKDVYQLEGGIINYLKSHPNKEFEGECFVFDHRVAVNQKLEPSKIYKLCPHCGQSADLKIHCSYCKTEVQVCTDCYKKEAKDTCSKNCAYHKKMKHRFKKNSPVSKNYFVKSSKV